MCASCLQCLAFSKCSWWVVEQPHWCLCHSIMPIAQHSTCPSAQQLTHRWSCPTPIKSSPNLRPRSSHHLWNDSLLMFINNFDILESKGNGGHSLDANFMKVSLSYSSSPSYPIGCYTCQQCFCKMADMVCQWSIQACQVVNNFANNDTHDARTPQQSTTPTLH